MLLALWIRAVRDRPVGRHHARVLVLQPGAVEPNTGSCGLPLHGTHGLCHVGQVLPGEIHVAVIEQDHVAGHVGSSPLDTLAALVGPPLIFSTNTVARFGQRHPLKSGRTSTFRLQALDPSAASLSATSRSAASMIQKPAMCSFDSRNGPSVKTASPARLSMTVAVFGDPRPPAKTQLPSAWSRSLNTSIAAI